VFKKRVTFLNYFFRCDLAHFSLSYHGRSLAPFRSIPSVIIANASGRIDNLAVPGSMAFGQEKVPFSSRLVMSHNPVPSK
jgi:hypothetical protein